MYVKCQQHFSHLDLSKETYSKEVNECLKSSPSPLPSFSPPFSSFLFSSWTYSWKQNLEHHILWENLVLMHSIMGMLCSTILFGKQDVNVYYSLMLQSPIPPLPFWVWWTDWKKCQWNKKKQFQKTWTCTMKP